MRKILGGIICVQLLSSAPALSQAVINARGKVFLGTGPNTRAFVKARDKYYALIWQDRSVLVYDTHMRLVGRIGSYGQGPSDLNGPWDVAVADNGWLYFADRGNQEIKIFDETGQFVRAFDHRQPMSLAVLSSGEICVVGFPRHALVSVFDGSGKLVRQFGETVEIAPEPRLNAFLNSGKIITDDEDHIFFAFLWNPEPTVRKYTSNGELLLEFHPDGKRIREASDQARAAMQERLEQGRAGGRGVLSGITIDPTTDHIWVSIADWVYRFNDAGRPIDYFRLADMEGNPINADEMVIEKDRMYVMSRASGIYEFKYPLDR